MMLILLKLLTTVIAFFRSSSTFLYGSDDKYNELREAVFIHCNENKDSILEFQKEVEIRPDLYIDTTEYINKIRINKNWATDIDIAVSSFIFGINIAIYIDKNKNYLGYANSYIIDNNIDIPLMALYNRNLNHFELVINRQNKNMTNNNNENNKKLNEDNLNMKNNELENNVKSK